MSFVADKKREHEASAEKALIEKDYATAFFHTAKAAEFGFALAEQSDGKISQRYIDDANQLLDIAEEIKEKANAKSIAKANATAEGMSGDDEGAESVWQVQEKPTERLDDVAGLSQVKEELRDKVIEPFLHPEIYDRFKVKIGGGILMYGPPGNGKTFVAKAVAGELDAAFFNVNASQIKDKYVGETEKNIQRLFEQARQHEKSVIFLDEADQLLSRKGNQKIGAVTQFLTAMDGFVKNTNCMLVLAATNKPWMLDDATLRPGRLGTHIYVGPPDAVARKAIFGYQLREVPIKDEVSIEEISKQTDGYSGADIAELCDRAKRLALRRQMESGVSESVSVQDFKTAMSIVRPSISEESISAFESWQESRLAPAGSESDDD